MWFYTSAMAEPNTRVAVDFKNHPDALRRLLKRAQDEQRSIGKQLLTEYLAATKDPAKRKGGK